MTWKLVDEDDGIKLRRYEQESGGYQWIRMKSLDDLRDLRLCLDVVIPHLERCRLIAEDIAHLEQAHD